MPSKVRDAQYWLDRAAEARLQAEDMTHPPAIPVIIGAAFIIIGLSIAIYRRRRIPRPAGEWYTQSMHGDLPGWEEPNG